MFSFIYCYTRARYLLQNAHATILYMKRTFRKIFTFWKIVLFGLVALCIFSVIKVLQLAEAPQNEKGCADLKNQKEDATDLSAFSFSKVLTWLQRGGTINDASCLDQTAVFGVVKIDTEVDISNALTYAQEQKKTVSIAGVRHSMGGHAFKKDALVLDMLAFNDIKVHEDSMTMTVQSGATWHDIQNVLHPKYAVAAMQSTDIFSVGGSISVNAHGMDHQIGAVENSIHSLRVMLADGNIKKVSRTENEELYNLVIGGYGLFGVILDIELDIVPNDIYESKRTIMSFSDFPEYFTSTIQTDPKIGLMYTHLSTAPTSLLEEAIVYTYTKSDTEVALSAIPTLEEVSSVKFRRVLMNFSKLGVIPQQLRWWAEKYLEPKFESCSISRAQAISSGEACLVARNEPMHDSVPYLYNNLTSETDILHEYFIPRENIVPFIDDMRTIIRENDINLLNASVRVVNKERGLLTYAPEEAFSVVLFINQEVSSEGNEKMKRDTQALIDLTHKYNGRFFLPYQLHYTIEQLRTSYPTLDTFLSEKKKYDPTELFSSTFYSYLKQE